MLYSLQNHGEKNDFEVTEYSGEIWINQKLILQIADRAQYYSLGFKKMRREIQERRKYQP